MVIDVIMEFACKPLVDAQSKSQGAEVHQRSKSNDHVSFAALASK